MGQERKSAEAVGMSVAGRGADEISTKTDIGPGMSEVGGRDAMRLKDAASCSFDCFHIDLKE